MIYRHSPEQVAEYYAKECINQSSLKVLVEDGIEKFISQWPSVTQFEDKLYYEEKDYFIIGGAVDSMISYGAETFEQKYFFSKLIKKPGPKAMAVVKMVFDNVVEEFPNGFDDTLLGFKERVYQACDAGDYYVKRRKPTYQEDTRIDSIIKEGGDLYFKELSTAIGKQILSENEKAKIDEIYKSLTTHQHTAWLFQDADDIDIIYQMPLYWTFEGVECKGLPDILIVNHTRKKIYPIDIKTTSRYVTKFNKVIKERRYDIQGAWYTFGVRENITNILELCAANGRKLAVSGTVNIIDLYTVADFAFVVESTTKSGCPLIFPLTPLALAQGRDGDGEELEGWRQAIGLFKIWGEKEFNLEKMFEETNGVIFVDDNFDYSINF